MNIRNVDVSSLSDSLVIDSGVGHDDDSWLLEGLGDVVGEVTGGESTGNGLSTGETGHLEDGSVTVWSSRDDGNVVGVLDGGEDSGSEDELLPSLTDVEDVDTWEFSLVSHTWVRGSGCGCSLLSILPLSYPIIQLAVVSDMSFSSAHSHAKSSRIPVPIYQNRIHAPSALRL